MSSKQICLIMLRVLKKNNNKNFAKNLKSKKGHNSCKNEVRVISLLCTYSTFHSEHIFSVLSIYVQLWQKLYGKMSSFSTMTMTPRL